MGLQHVLYSVQEGDSLMLCAELVGQIEINVEVTLSTLSDGSTEGTCIDTYTLAVRIIIPLSIIVYTFSATLSVTCTDYLPVSEVLTFEPGVLKNCINFSALSDVLVENEEIVLVVLSNANPQNVTLDPSQATIVIVDTTGIPIK